MNTSLINKVLQRYHLGEAAEILSARLNTSELTTFLMHIFANRIVDVTPMQLRHAITTDRFVTPSAVSPLVFHAFDKNAFDHLPAHYELMELSPLAPFGTVSALATVDPGLVVNTIRSQDVVSDSTNILALIAAGRRHKKQPKSFEVNLAASQRLVRAQAPQHKNHTAHFKILTLVSAGRDMGSFEFERRHLQEHLQYYINLIRSFNSTSDTQIEILIKEYVDTGIHWNSCFPEIKGNPIQYAHQRMTREDWNYYSPFQFNINVRTQDGVFNIADGGMVDWTQKLLSDKKERLLISGFGTELFCKIFMS